MVNKTTSDAEHPSIIPMDSTPTYQAPRGPMTRARARVETKVNSFLVYMHMDTSGTWLLPHQNTLCLLRYEEEHHQGAQEHHQGEGGPPQGPTDEDINTIVHPQPLLLYILNQLLELMHTN